MFQSKDTANGNGRVVSKLRQSIDVVESRKDKRYHDSSSLDTREKLKGHSIHSSVGANRTS